MNDIIKLKIDGIRYFTTAENYEKLTRDYLRNKNFGDNSKFTSDDKVFMLAGIGSKLKLKENVFSDFGLQLAPMEAAKIEREKKAASIPNRITVRISKATENNLSKLAEVCGKSVCDIFAEFAAALSGNDAAKFYEVISNLHAAKKNLR